jgi:hypothetical protein
VLGRFLAHLVAQGFSERSSRIARGEQPIVPIIVADGHVLPILG